MTIVRTKVVSNNDGIKWVKFKKKRCPRKFKKWLKKNGRWFGRNMINGWLIAEECKPISDFEKKYIQDISKY